MGPRRKSREYALEVMYQIDLKKDTIAELETILDDYWPHKKMLKSESKFKEVQEFTFVLLKGVLDHLEEIDQCIRQSIEHWSIEQISKIDKNIMRIAVFEILYLENIPASVTINEAVEVAKRYGSEESPKFINGVLDEINKRANCELA